VKKMRIGDRIESDHHQVELWLEEEGEGRRREENKKVERN